MTYSKESGAPATRAIGGWLRQTFGKPSADATPTSRRASNGWNILGVESSNVKSEYG